MRIPSDLTVPYLIEITERPQPDNSRAEPVGAATRLDDALAEAPLDQRPDAEAPPTARARRTNGSMMTVTVERRVGDRRREKRPTLLDTRTAVGRRRSGRHTRISAKA